MASSEGFRNEKRETVLRTLWGERATLERLETAQMSPARGGNDSVRESIWFPGGEQGGSESLYGPREVSREGQESVCSREVRVGRVRESIWFQGGEQGGSESVWP